MNEIDRIASLMEQIFEGDPYYGPSVMGTLEGVTAVLAVQKPPWSAHSIWELVSHLTAELNYAREVINGTAGPWVEGETTWPAITDNSEIAWQRAIKELKNANRELVHIVKQLDDSILDQQPAQVRGPYYLMLHGAMQHNIFHSGQISLLGGN
jgi:hypothetical protein